MDAMMKAAMRLALDHIHWAQAQGMTNREILRGMGKCFQGDMPTDFYVCGEIAKWYITSFWGAVDNFKKDEQAGGPHDA